MMEEAEESLNDFMQCFSGTSPSTASASMPLLRANRLDLSNFDGPQVRGQFRHLPPSPDPAKRIGIPPAHTYFSPSPYQQISTTAAAAAAAVRSPSSSQLFISVPTHSRSLSQPAFFNLDSLPQFTSHSPPFADSSPAASDPSSSADVEMDDGGVTVASSHGTPPPVPLARSNSGGGSGRATGDGLPPRKAHRRSQSDIPFGFLQSFAAAAPLPPLPHQASGFPSHLVSSRTSNQFVKQEGERDREGDGSAERKSGSDGDVGDDLFSAYMNLESLDTLNSSGTEEKREDSRASGTKTNGADSSENEAESSVNESGSSLQLRGVSSERKEGNKRSAAADPAPINLSASRHNRSISMDSFMGKLQFREESPKLPPSPGLQPHSRSGSLDGMTNTFSLEFGNGAFSGTESKKIMANEKLAEIAMADPKRAKRILANRQSAARSKERKMRYISELEHKVQTLQTEATTLSAQLTLLQRDSAGLTSQNSELKFRLQAMEQQTQLRDALNEALTAEVQRLKLAAGEAQLANTLNQQMQLNPQMFSLQQPLHKQQQQSSLVSHYLMQPQQQPQQQQQQQKNKDFSKRDSSK